MAKIFASMVARLILLSRTPSALKRKIQCSG
jgi:hypothetical protein